MTARYARAIPATETPNGRRPRITVKERAGRVLRLLLIDLEERLLNAREPERGRAEHTGRRGIRAPGC